MSKYISYLAKSDIDKSFKKLQKESTGLIETDYNKCCDIIKEMKEAIISNHADYTTICAGNLEDAIAKYNIEYKAYIIDFEKSKKDRSNYYRPTGNPKTLDEYIENKLNLKDVGTVYRFKNYSPTRKEEKKVLYFDFNRHSNSSYTFSFCVYFNSRNMLCLDKITFKESIRRKEFVDIETAKILPNKMEALISTFLELNIKGKIEAKKRGEKQEANNIKKSKIKNLKQRAGLVNIKKIMNTLDCDYGLETMKSDVKIHVNFEKGRATIKIKQKDINNSLEFLSELVENILKADKLNIHCRYKQY